MPQAETRMDYDMIVPSGGSKLQDKVLHNTGFHLYAFLKHAEHSKIGKYQIVNVVKSAHTRTHSRALL